LQGHLRERVFILGILVPVKQLQLGIAKVAVYQVSFDAQGLRRVETGLIVLKQILRRRTPNFLVEQARKGRGHIRHTSNKLPGFSWSGQLRERPNVRGFPFSIASLAWLFLNGVNHLCLV
jgi:hypothetical protein